VGTEAADALAADLPGFGVGGEVIQRVPGVGRLRLAVGPLDRSQQRGPGAEPGDR